MKRFNDSTGAEWKLELTLGSAKRIKDDLGIDLLCPAKDNEGKTAVERLWGDAWLMGEAILCLLSDQIAGSEISTDAMRQRFNGKALTEAEIAFREELIDFFRSRDQVEWAETVIALAKVNEAERKIAARKFQSLDVNAVIRKLEAEAEGIDLNATLLKRMESEMKKVKTSMAGLLSGESPEPAE